MFSGLVACMGEVCALSPQGRDLRLTVNTEFSISQIKNGDSVALNGACLTVESCSAWGAGNSQFTAFVSYETLANTNLAALKSGSRVNLELALALGDRLGGHMVSGHVDGLAKVEQVEQTGQSRQVSFACAKEFDPYIVPKGSVCLDGISLTVIDCAPGFFKVNIIPETWLATTAVNWFPGYQVNLETDMLGKFVAKMLAAYTSGNVLGNALGNTHANSNEATAKQLEMDFFLKNGF